VVLEWPVSLRLGDSDIIRLSLVPTKDGLDVEAEFPEHEVQTQHVPVEHPAGYDLFAAARLDGVGFEISPAGEQAHPVYLDETITWRWTLAARQPGQQRLSISLVLRWTPQSGVSGATHQATVYSRGLDVQVTSFFGLSRTQALFSGFFGLLLGSGMGLAALVVRSKPVRSALRVLKPNPAVAIEPRPGLVLVPYESELLRALFSRYARLVLESEFLSGYSGARTFLLLPIRGDGHSDAYTIVKIGQRQAIQREFENYELYVKDSLPPITARIQHIPVALRDGERAAVQYTFIAEPGRMPSSLHQALWQDGDPGLIHRLFDTFGPNWWMQRQPYSFRLGQEYDRLLPPHYVLQPCQERSRRMLGESASPAEYSLEPGEVVGFSSFASSEPRQDGKSCTVSFNPPPGMPALRLRWLAPHPPERRSAGRVVAARTDLLSEMVKGFDLCGMPNPLLRLPDIVNESVTGTRSIIHGDLNLENALVGPGGFVWLIDFALTRQGHTLFDFARLETEIIAHILAPHLTDPSSVVSILQSRSNALLNAVEEIASRCLFNPSQPREYQLALLMSCLGALKYSNVDEQGKRCLFLAAAWLAGSI